MKSKLLLLFMVIMLCSMVSAKDFVFVDYLTRPPNEPPFRHAAQCNSEEIGFQSCQDHIDGVIKINSQEDNCRLTVPQLSDPAGDSIVVQFESIGPAESATIEVTAAGYFQCYLNEDPVFTSDPRTDSGLSSFESSCGADLISTSCVRHLSPGSNKCHHTTQKYTIENPNIVAGTNFLTCRIDRYSWWRGFRLNHFSYSMEFNEDNSLVECKEADETNEWDQQANAGAGRCCGDDPYGQNADGLLTTIDDPDMGSLSCGSCHLGNAFADYEERDWIDGLNINENLCCGDDVSDVGRIIAKQLCIDKPKPQQSPGAFEWVDSIQERGLIIDSSFLKKSFLAHDQGANSDSWVSCSDPQDQSGSREMQVHNMQGSALFGEEPNPFPIGGTSENHFLCYPDRDHLQYRIAECCGESLDSCLSEDQYVLGGASTKKIRGHSMLLQQVPDATGKRLFSFIEDTGRGFESFTHETPTAPWNKPQGVSQINVRLFADEEFGPVLERDLTLQPHITEYTININSQSTSITPTNPPGADPLLFVQATVPQSRGKIEIRYRTDAHCFNKVQDEDERGVDCGGLRCKSCDDQVRYYCTEEGTFVHTDLDEYQLTCENAVDEDQTTRLWYNWTGNFCCGEEDDESYNEPGEQKACLDSITYNTARRINEYPQLILNEGSWWGCKLEDHREDPGLEETARLLTLKDSQQPAQDLIQSKDYCTQAQGGFFCNVSGMWEFQPIEQELHQKPRPAVWADKEQTHALSCCLENQCWNGSSCISSQAHNPNSPLQDPDDSIRCIDGEWEDAVNRTGLDGTQGFCPQTTQCLVSTNGNHQHNNLEGANPQCINDGQFIEQNYCASGFWISRTRQVANNMIELAADQDYTLLCGTHTETLNNAEYTIIRDGAQRAVALASSLFTQNPVTLLSTCVLNTTSQSYVGFVANNDWDDDDPLTIILPNLVGCQDGSCQGTAAIQRALRLLFYSTRPFTPSVEVEHLSQFWLDANTGVETPADINTYAIGFEGGEIHTARLLNPEKIFISKKGEKVAFAAIQDNVLIADYQNVDAQAFCDAIEEFKPSRVLTDDQMKCVVLEEGSRAKVIVQGTHLGIHHFANEFWLDLTGRLRLS